MYLPCLHERPPLGNIANYPLLSITHATVHNITLNGIDGQRAERRSLLDGSYLKLKLQQLTGQPWTPMKQLKQSNSDNYINQLGAGTNQSRLSEAPHKRPFQLQQQAVFNSAGATLPKNLSHLQRPASNQYYPLAGEGGQLQVLAKLGANQQQVALQQQQQVLHLQDFENPYGIKSGASLAGSASPSAGYSATTYSATSTTTSGIHQQEHQQPTFAALMLSNGAQTNGIGSSSSSSSYLASGFAPTGETRVEQLVISGKQYIHQTSGSASSRASLYRAQQQQQQQQRHLQLTSSSCNPAYGSLQRAANNLYTAPMKDYLHLQQQQPPHYLAHNMNQQQRASPFCEHRQQTVAPAVGGGMVDPVVDGLYLGGPSCLANVGALQQAQVAGKFRRQQL